VINQYIDFLRFESDEKTRLNEDKTLIHQINSTKRSLLSNSLRVTKQTVPSLFMQIEECLEILKLDQNTVDIYVYSKPDYNAFSISQMDATILIGISSSLIKILNPGEIKFLVGHELGHGILGHSESTHLSKGNLNYQLLKSIRNMEISADRIGYLCSKSLDHSITSMMKLASGLDGEMLSTDIRPFLDQSIDIEEMMATQIGNYSTHPPLPIRAKALVLLSTLSLFDESGTLNNLTNEHNKKIVSINHQITNLVSTLMDENREQSFKTSQQFFKLLLYTWYYSVDGVLSKKEQDHLLELFGDKAKKIFSLMVGSSTNGVLDMLERKLKDTFDDMLYYSRDSSLEYFNKCCDDLNISSDEIIQMINPF
tara:strand:- start:975 stop:2078 length:1104 start_codon:yes stop_codon:yes gene_type:complete